MTEQEIFIEAFERPDPTERDRYLDEACGTNSVLRSRITRLLELSTVADRVLDSPLVVLTSPKLTPGMVVADRYRLVEPFGEGAMGVVWRAEQFDPVQREVALKILHAEYDTGSVLARFEAERQLLGRMDHPSIATIFDAGLTAQGQRFFVLEAIRGPSITRFAQERALGVEARIELFIPACRAIQHAHQKGVIHRDIKPGNILIAVNNETAIPKVIDFGVAKSLDVTDPNTRLTRLGAIIGTPQYMSPEQAELNNPDVDTRSDVYSLGAVLYELLTGRPPVETGFAQGQPLLDVLRAIREDTPPRPSAKPFSAGNLPVARWRELDAIVLTCLAKDRKQRYPSSEALADDLTRFLANEPVRACSPSRGYHLAKFLHRNRGRVLLAGIALMFLIGGSIGTAIGFVRANRAAHAEALQRAAAERERDAKDLAVREAESHLITARRALSHMNRIATELAFEPRMEVTWKNLLRDSTQFFEELHAARPEEPAVG